MAENLNFASVALREDGIIKVEVIAEVKVTIKQVSEISRAIGRVGGGKSYPVLINAATHSFPDENARRYLTGNDTKNYALAEAYVIYSLSQKLVANFYLKFHKPQRPTRVFSNEEDAVRWLKDYLPVPTKLNKDKGQFSP